MSEELKEIRKKLISEKPQKESNELKLFKKTKEFEKRITKLEKELKTKEKRLKEANDFIRKYIPAFPSSNNQINLEYAKELIEKELNRKKKNE